ncbi:hypothetical protein [Roseateles sp.]|uniref:hypothetical protein n=1 Tax=Roseateles sp. TaxID=1971397 RepID=UPI0037CCADB3
MDWIANASGFGDGLSVRISGVGGGSLMQPPMLSVSKLHPTAASGTDLCLAGLSQVSGFMAHARHAHANGRLPGAGTVLRFPCDGRLEGHPLIPYR